PKVAIPLPPALAKAEKGLRMVGMGGEADQLKTTMNHAAEQAVAAAKPGFKKALQKMKGAGPKGNLAGGEGRGERDTLHTTSAGVGAKFEPIVAKETAKLRVGALYDQYAGKAAGFGLISKQDANLNDYVTQKTLDGLFSRIADEEKAIRQNPVGQANSLIK